MKYDRFVHAYFRELDQVLKAKSNIIKTNHKGDAGESRENILVDALNDHLPLVSRAHQGGSLLDYRDSLSSQTDVVIYSNWAPLLRQSHKPIFLASGCYAALEVKTTLTTENLRAAFKASERIKAMNKFALAAQQHGVFPETRTANTICTGVFAFDSKIAQSKIFDIIEECEQANMKNTSMLDFISIIGQGCLTRHPTEDLTATRNRTMYLIHELSFGRMLEKLLTYITYVGPTDHHFDLYLHHYMTGDFATGKVDFSASRKRRHKSGKLNQGEPR